MDIIITILVFFGIIIIHEMGHFLTARAFGMKIYEFSIGMGPRLFSKTTKTTTWSFKLLPIGGAVQLGEDLESDDPDDFRNKPVWQRMLVIVAGPIMNLILGYIVCVVSVCAGADIATTRVSGFYDGSASSQVMRVGDEIVEMSGMTVFTTMDISYCFHNTSLEKTKQQTDNEDSLVYFDMTVLRDGSRVKLSVPFKYKAVTDDTASSGIVVDFTVFPEEKNVFTVLRAAFNTFLYESRLIWISFRDLITGSYGLNDLSGPVGVVGVMSNSIRVMSFSSFLMLVALITINLGIFNLLPVPALDGARFLFLIIEAVRGKPVPAEKEGIVHFVGFAALMLLMLVVTYNDIVKLVTGQLIT